MGLPLTGTLYLNNLSQPDRSITHEVYGEDNIPAQVSLVDVSDIAGVSPARITSFYGYSSGIGLMFQINFMFSDTPPGNVLSGNVQIHSPISPFEISIPPIEVGDSSNIGPISSKLIGFDPPYNIVVNIGSLYNGPIIEYEFELVNLNISGFLPFNGTIQHDIVNDETIIIDVYTPNIISSYFNIGTGFGGRVQTTSILPNGNIIVGGVFTSYKGNTANRIIMLDQQGNRITDFDIGTGFNSSVQTTSILPNDNIIVGGGFTSYKGVGANYIIMLDQQGNRITDFDIGTGFNSIVETTSILPNGNIIVGGSFTNYKGSGGANHIIMLDQQGNRITDFDIGSGFNSSVQTTSILPNDNIIVGGGFTSYKGVGANRIVMLDQQGKFITIT